MAQTRMRSLHSFLFPLVAGLFAACAPQHVTSQLDPTWDEAMQVFSLSVGFLKIYIATQEERVFSDDPPGGTLRYEPYEVFTDEGKKIKTVSTTFYEPQTIVLFPGKYVVVAKIGENQFKKFGVIIESGKTTVVENLQQ